MIANALSKIFLKWYQENNPDARIFRNNSGAVKTAKSLIRYGIPSKGGSDFISFVPKSYTNYDVMDDNLISKYCLTVEMYEIKTKNDKMSKDQIKFANLITQLGGEYFIVKECKYGLNAIENDFVIEKWSVK